MLISRTFHLSFSAKKNQAKKKPTAPKAKQKPTAPQSLSRTVETEPAPPTAASNVTAKVEPTVETEPATTTAASHAIVKPRKEKPGKSIDSNTLQ